MRRYYLYDFATLPTALAVALGAACLVTAFAHLFNQLHGLLDVTWALSVWWAVRRHDERRDSRDHKRNARAAAGYVEQELRGKDSGEGCEGRACG